MIVKHSGHIGDIIYSLSFVKSLNEKVNYTLGFDMLNQTPNHPSGKYTMTPKSYEYIKPLLEHQEYIDIVTKHRGIPVNYDLDLFRSKGFNVASYDLRKWYELVYPITSVDLSDPGIKCDLPNLDYLKDKIVVNFSLRYRNNQIDYSKLKKFEDSLVFVGLDEEYANFNHISKLNIKRVNIKDALHMAQVIKSSKLFIGNQSSSFAIAEQLKHPRLLELYNQSPNVITVNKGAAYTNTETLLKKIY